ncbi:MAG: hypothetical protein IJI96_02750 [Methanobrevibacter sp.]|nr:hypothetical protein [Methanobrevibacter sp.]MBQ6627426.1 hypothetical protein [Methanobrevibacter sp.]
MVLTADDILNGIEEYKEVQLESLGDSMYLRPLSKGEWEKVNSIRQEALGDYTTNETAKSLSRNQRISNIQSQLKFNIKENGDAEFKAQTEAIFMSLDNPGYEKQTPREKIKKFKPDLFDELYEKVKEISGISDDAIVDLEDEIDNFPED